MPKQIRTNSGYMRSMESEETHKMPDGETMKNSEMKKPKKGEKCKMCGMTME